MNTLTISIYHNNVKNCFSEAGFDDIEAITGRDIDKCIAETEAFIEKRKDNLPHCLPMTHCTNLSIPFEFVPGHRVRIIKALKRLQETNKTQDCSSSVPKPTKKGRIVRTPDTENDEIPSIKQEVRMKMLEWSKEDGKNEIDENKSYGIIVSRNPLNPVTCVASIRCVGCGKSILLPRKKTGKKPFQIGNLKKHYEICKAKKKSGTQLKLQNY